MKIKEAYNLWAEQYDTNDNKTRDLDKKITQIILKKYNFSTVIELGCGTGKNTEFLLTKSQNIIGIDFSEEMLRKAKSKFNNKKVSFHQRDLTTNWGITNTSADLITCNLVLEHINNLEPIFKQAFQKLNNNGILFVCELHPFKQYTGSKARFETKNGTQELEAYVHHISDFLNAAKSNNYKVIELNEWFDEDNKKGIPRLVSFVFRK